MPSVPTGCTPANRFSFEHDDGLSCLREAASGSKANIAGTDHNSIGSRIVEQCGSVFI
jgi:hypothetical protein